MYRSQLGDSDCVPTAVYNLFVFYNKDPIENIVEPEISFGAIEEKLKEHLFKIEHICTFWPGAIFDKVLQGAPIIAQMSSPIIPFGLHAELLVPSKEPNKISIINGLYSGKIVADYTRFQFIKTRIFRCLFGLIVYA